MTNANVNSITIQFHDESFNRLLNKPVGQINDADFKDKIIEFVCKYFEHISNDILLFIPDAVTKAFEMVGSDYAENIMLCLKDSIRFEFTEFDIDSFILSFDTYLLTYKSQPYIFQLFNEESKESEEDKDDKEDKDNYSFGVVQVEMNSIPAETKPIDVGFMLDMSGSMSQENKEQIVTHLMKNIIKVFGESDKNNGTNVSVCIMAFDDAIETILPFTRVTESNFAEINSIFGNKYLARGQTNIGLALTNIPINHDPDGTRNKHTIFMTDGDTNIGITRPDLLFDLVDPSYSHSFISLGKSCNSKLLDKLAEHETGQHVFISNIEQAPLDFAEIMHSILFTAAKNVSLTVDGDGEIYDYVDGKWKKQIYIHSIVSEAKKTFHVRTKNPDLVKVIMTCSSQTEPIEATVIESGNLNYYKHRQRTQELMFDSKMGQISKEQLYAYFSYLQNFMKENGLVDDLKYTTLSNDIFIVYKTFGSLNAEKYCNARMTSQGRQTSTQVNDFDDYSNSRGLRRQYGNGGLQRQGGDYSVFENPVMNYSSGQNDIDSYIIKQQLSENTSPSQLKLMRSVSANTKCNTIVEDHM